MSEEEKNKLIEYLEEKIKKHSHEHYVEDLHMRWDLNEEIRKELQDVLERIKSGKYD